VFAHRIAQTQTKLRPISESSEKWIYSLITAEWTFCFLMYSVAQIYEENSQRCP
jgi:hypothetical protein